MKFNNIDDVLRAIDDMLEADGDDLYASVLALLRWEQNEDLRLGRDHITCALCANAGGIGCTRHDGSPCPMDFFDGCGKETFNEVCAGDPTALLAALRNTVALCAAQKLADQCSEKLIDQCCESIEKAFKS